jgi:hypothetical protein
MRRRVWERRRSNLHITLLPRTERHARGVLGRCTLVDEMDVQECVTSVRRDQVCKSKMSAILIRCRKTSRVVPTGLTTENVKFVSLAGIQFSMVCPRLWAIHRSKQRDAWVEGSDQTKRHQHERY